MSTLLPIIEPGSEATLRIGDLAKRAGKSTRAVRLYEEKGLLGPALRTEGGHRLYADDALQRLSWIDKLQLLGLSLSDIKAFLDDLAAAHAAPEAMERARDLFETKLAEVRTQIATLRSIEAELSKGVEYLEACDGCAPTTEVTACKSCGQPHPVEPPHLVVAMHGGGEGRSP
ncbi:MAG: MerR family transcriptional regulator [Myxococcota bacterium]